MKFNSLEDGYLGFSKFGFFEGPHFYKNEILRIFFSPKIYYLENKTGTNIVHHHALVLNTKYQVGSSIFDKVIAIISELLVYVR